MLILEELQKTYTVASLYRGIFIKAIQQVFPGYQICASAGQPAGHAVADTTAPSESITEEPVFANACEGLDLGLNENFDFVDALMDQTSLFNIWEHWNAG